MDDWTRAFRERYSERGFTQETLAREVGVSHRAVQRWATGQSVPRRRMMLRLEELLGDLPPPPARAPDDAFRTVLERIARLEDGVDRLSGELAELRGDGRGTQQDLAEVRDDLESAAEAAQQRQPSPPGPRSPGRPVRGAP
jgi:transcriptional regulator with XRE-family HTH domain